MSQWACLYNTSTLKLKQPNGIQPPFIILHLCCSWHVKLSSAEKGRCRRMNKAANDNRLMQAWLMQARLQHSERCSIFSSVQMREVVFPFMWCTTPCTPFLTLDLWGAASDNSSNFLKPTSRHLHPLHGVISQLCRGEGVGLVRTSLSCSFCFFILDTNVSKNKFHERLSQNVHLCTELLRLALLYDSQLLLFETAIKTFAVGGNVVLFQR